MTQTSSVVRVIDANDSKRKRVIRANFNKIPDTILHDEKLNEAIAVLPKNYNFEIHKSVWKVRSGRVRRLGLQLPEGLTMFATTLSDIFTEFCDDCEDCVIMADVTYGACCIDDFTATALGCEMLIHYGHSCLIPIDQTSSKLKVLYVFVDIKIDVDHVVQSVEANVHSENLVLVGTIQYSTSLHKISTLLRKNSASRQVTVPQSLPLTSGELLGCTSPRIGEGSAVMDHDPPVVIYIGDGRFHLESMMIANPSLRFIKYDPMSKDMSEEFYDHKRMKDNRLTAIEEAKSASKWGVILGTLGRQGSLKVLQTIEKQFKRRNLTYTLYLMSEIFPDKLDMLSSIDAWVQIACPRLSIDWGSFFSKPLLTSYEAMVALSNNDDDVSWCGDDTPYPMDFYAKNSSGPWTPNHQCSVKGTGECCKSQQQ